MSERARALTCPLCGEAFDPRADEGGLVCPHCGADLRESTAATELITPGQQVRVPPSAEETLEGERQKPAEVAPVSLRSFGRYEILEEIGRGAFGIVYKARDPALKRTVALKLLIAGEGASEDDIERFVREAESAAKLRHPNIVPIHELDIHEGKHFFTMDFIEGRALSDVIDAGGIAPRRAAEVIVDVARAVHHAHEHGVIHRDIKPANILVTPEGRPMVTDFGLAKQVEADSSLTRSGTAMGTPSYMPPEQAQGRVSDIDARSDVYSLGAVLYEMMTGLPPFVGATQFEVMEKVVYDDPIPPRTFNRACPADLETICLKCLEKDSRRRYQSAADLADDARRFLEGDPIAARPASILYKTRKKLAKHRGVSIVTALAAVSLLALGIFSYVRIVRERNDAREALARYEEAEAAKKEIEEKVEAEAAREWHLVFEDDFSDAEGVEERWQFAGAQHGGSVNREIKGGELRMWGGLPQVAILKQPVAGDIRIEFDCRQESEFLNDVSCFMCAVPQKEPASTVYTGYIFQYGGRGNMRIALLRLEAILWERRASPLVKGRPYHVRAEKVGARLTCTVDGEVVFDTEDEDPLAGPDRTAVGLYGWEADTYYDNVKVYTLGPPRKADLLDLADEYFDRGRYAAASDLFRDVADTAIDPERKRRAESGVNRAVRMAGLAAKLPEYRAILDRAWPGTSRGLKVVHEGFVLDISRQEIEDLTPVKGMQLTRLNCSFNKITNLAPLTGMPLTELDCIRNRITSLEPLRGMRLEALRCERNLVTSLEPLRGMPLNSLGCGGNKITDLEPLRGTPLLSLSCHLNRITSLKPLRRMPLQRLVCHGNQITSLDPLRGMPLQRLVCYGNQITSLDPLRGMPLKQLKCHGNQITSLDALRGMPLDILSCASNRIASLEPFIENPAEVFHFYGDSLPTPALEAARDAWSTDARCQAHTRNVNLFLSLRSGDFALIRRQSAPFGGHTYLLLPWFVTWNQARARSRELGGHLVTITSAEENDFVKELARDSGANAWIGLTDESHEGRWKWVTGEEVAFTDWSPGEPDNCSGNEHGGILASWLLFGWADYEKARRTGFIVEWDE